MQLTLQVNGYALLILVIIMHVLFACIPSLQLAMLCFSSKTLQEVYQATKVQCPRLNLLLHAVILSSVHCFYFTASKPMSQEHDSETAKASYVVGRKSN